MNNQKSDLYGILIQKVDEEINRRKRIDELQKENNVIEYLQRTNTKPISNTYDIREILKSVFENFYVDSNLSSKKIYICSEAFSESVNVDADDSDAIIKIYRDIEATDDSVGAIKDNVKNLNDYNISELIRHYCLSDITTIDKFEKSHVVINPWSLYITSYDYDFEELFDELRTEYYSYLLETQSQDKAIDMILSKYPRL